MKVKIKNSKFNKVMKGKRKVNILQIVTVDTDRLSIDYRYTKLIILFFPIAYIVGIFMCLFYLIPVEIFKSYKSMTDNYNGDYTVQETIDKLIEK